LNKDATGKCRNLHRFLAGWARHCLTAIRLQRRLERYEAALQEGEIVMSTTTTPLSPQGLARTAGPGGRRQSRRPRHVIAAVIAAGAVCLALAMQASAAGASTTFTPPTPDVGIVPFAGDVYTTSSNGTLIPVFPGSTPLSAPLYNLAGGALNVTWGQWSSATATSYAWTVTFKGTTYTHFAIGMSGLVPDGVYSLFYRTFAPDSNNAFCPDVEPSIALPAAFPRPQKPDPDSFIAGSSGKALFVASVAQDLLAAQQLSISVIYHFNGQTYGPVANAAEAAGPVNNGLCRSSYGVDAMRQMLIIQK
jgi:hypothetical protein